MPYSPDHHPIGLMPIFERLAGEPFSYEFSKYIYRPQTVYDTRETFRTSADRVIDAFTRELATLTSQQEIALHSKLTFASGRVAHIPMLDLMGPELDDYTVEMLKQGMADFGIEKFGIYSSGNSFHVYGHGLLPHEELSHFFGRALLLNLPNARTVVDTRWVGHRLMGEFGSLRWTNNSGTYVGVPKKRLEVSTR